MNWKSKVKENVVKEIFEVREIGSWRKLKLKKFEIEGRRRWNTELVNNNEEDDLITDKVENDETRDKVMLNVMRSNRKRDRQFNIPPDEIGECEEEDYK